MKKHSLIAAGILLAITSGSASAYNDIDKQIAINRNTSAVKRAQYVKATADELATVRAALQSYFLDNHAWPANLQQLKTAKYYSGDFKTVYGPIVGSPTANGFDVNVDLPDGASSEVISKMIAVQSSATQSGGNIKMSVSAPSSAVIVDSMLSRIPDAANPNNNKMMQGINLNNFDIDNVKSLDADAIDVTNMKISENLIVAKDATVGGNQKITGNQTVEGTQTVIGKAAFKDNVSFEKDVTVSGKLDVAGGISMGKNTVVDASGALYDQGVKVSDVYSKLSGDNNFEGNNTFKGETSFVGNVNATGVVNAATLSEGNVALKDKYLGINATAVNSDKLGNVAAGQYARNDVSNVFKGTQRFTNNVTLDKGITAATYTGGTFTGTKFTGTEFVEGDVALKDKYLGINATADNSLTAEKLANVDANKYARRDQANTFDGVSIFNSQGQFKQDVSVEGMLTAANLKVTGDVNIDGTATAKDFKLASSVGNKRSLKEALTWIKKCESKEIDVCQPGQATGPEKSYDFTVYNASSAMVFMFASNNKIDSSIYSELNYGKRTQSCSTNSRGRTNCYYHDGKRASDRFKVTNASIKDAKVTWARGGVVKWTGNVNSYYTPETGKYEWTVSVVGKDGKTIASAIVNIGNNGYQDRSGNIRY